MAFFWKRTNGRKIERWAATLLVLAVVAMALGCRETSSVSDKTIDLLNVPGKLVQGEVPTGEGGKEDLGEQTGGSWDFEGGGTAEWWIRTYSGRTHGGVTKDAAHSGDRGFCIEAVGGVADADAQLHLRVRPGTEYRLVGYVRTFELEPKKARVYGGFYLGEFAYLRADNRDFNDPIRWHVQLPRFRGTTDDWKRVTYTFETLPRTRMLRLGASLANWGKATGKVCFDDVSITEVAGGDGGLSRGQTQREPYEIRSTSIDGVVRRGLAVPSRSEYRVTASVPARAWLHFGTGLEDQGSRESGTALFEVAVVAGGKEATIFSRRFPLSEGSADEHWLAADVSLEAYGGRQVELVFRTVPTVEGERPQSRHLPAPVWTNPLLYVRRSEGDRRREPDVFLITIDTLRADHLGAYGYQRDTSPAIDGLAADGVLFENAFTPLPRTTPSLASMLTGVYPRVHGLMTLLDTLGDDSLTLAELMKEHGYATGAVVTHNVSWRGGLEQGFDTFAGHLGIRLPNPEGYAEPLVEEAIRWVSDHAGMKSFLWLHVWDPHFRYEAKSPAAPWIEPELQASFDLYRRLDQGKVKPGDLFFHNDLPPEQVEHVIALYDGEIRYTDEAVGRFLDALKRLGLYDRSLIVIASDHGESLGEQEYFFEHGDYLYDSTVRIPLIIKYPYNRTKGLRVAGQAMIMDVMPTILSVAGVPVAENVAGKDLTLYLDGKSDPHPEWFAETGRRFYKENPRRYIEGIAGNWRGIRVGGWQLIEIPTPTGPICELYDVVNDPGETRNLYRPDHPQVARLTARLEGWLERFEQGELPPGAGEAKIDDEAAEQLRALGYME